MTSKYLNEDGTLDRQLVINDVWAGVKSQGFALSVTYDEDDGEYSDVCAYNGMNGTHCAIGWLLKDVPEDKVARFEGEGVGSVHNDEHRPVLELIGLQNLSTEDVLFLTGLQCSHDIAWDAIVYELDEPDFARGATLFETNLRNYITSNNLEIPE